MRRWLLPVAILAGAAAFGMASHKWEPLFEFSVVTAVLLLPELVRRRAERRRHRQLTEKPCPVCGYSLRENASGICPECGARIRWRCSHCGAELDPAAASCPACRIHFAKP